jgi:hypothetical protein
MKFRYLLSGLVIILIIRPFGFPFPLGDIEIYRARMLTNRGPIDTPVVNLKIEIEDYSDTEENWELQKVMNQSGFNAFLNAFQESNKGVIKVTGGRGWQIRINVAQIRYTENGSKISLFLERQNWDTTTTVRVSQNFFMVMELNVDESGNGDGRLYEDVQIHLNERGWFEIVKSDAAPKMLMAVTRVIKDP